ILCSGVPSLPTRLSSDPVLRPPRPTLFPYTTLFRSVPPGRWVGVSGIVHGLAGVADGYRQALLALRARAGSSGLSRYDECLPEALLLTSPEIADDLVRMWLDPLLALPPAEARDLLRTLRAWVACGGSTVRTAKAVPCHRNTVINRLRRVAQLTGRSLADDA